MKRTAALLLVAVTVLALAGTGCCPLLASADRQPAEEGGIGGAAEAAPSLEEFLDADAKTGEYTASTTYPDGEVWETAGVFWVDGDLFRYDLVEDGDLLRSIMTPDGETAYFCEVADQVSTPSVAGVDFYLAEYSRPGDDSREDGIDEESGATRVVYEMRKTFSVPGSSNSWYVEDITYLVEDDVVVGLITRGCVPEDDGSIGPLDTTRKMFSNVKVGVPIPAETFELPYPIQEAASE